MAAQKSMLSQFPWDSRYRVSGTEDVLTPALLIYPEFIGSNIEATLALVGGDADRWRVHIKTAKLGHTLRMLVERGVRNFKCATTLELLVACQLGAADVLLAYPSVGANARRAREIADQFPDVGVSVLAENDEQIRQWRGSRLGIFLDINPGMNRTGIEQSQKEKVRCLARAIGDARLEFRGLHYYDGQYGALDERERTEAAHRGYDGLLRLAGEIERSGLAVPEVITAGTPTLPCSLSYEGFRSQAFIHRVSPGTVVYCDATSLAQLPAEYGYRPAVLVLTRVVSRPRGIRLSRPTQVFPPASSWGIRNLLHSPPAKSTCPSRWRNPPQARKSAKPSTSCRATFVPRSIILIARFWCAMARSNRSRKSQPAAAKRPCSTPWTPPFPSGVVKPHSPSKRTHSSLLVFTQSTSGVCTHTASRERNLFQNRRYSLFARASAAV
jgi:D-serine deaminase-like pyridoxal phosphate-dependent protein